ncbi:MAG: GNAT family N-acetyltransferase, partial [Christensenellales bacterium]
RHMNECGIPQWDEVYPARPDIQSDIAAGEMFVLLCDGEIACAFTLNRDCDEQYHGAPWRYGEPFYVLHRLCVDPRYQNRGIAARALACSERYARENGAGSMRLDAFSLNPHALRLYENNGYRYVGDVHFRKGLFYLYEKAL